ncbi:MAG: hypothetical protein ACE5MK_01710 [Acidobacteriota bacterium]
MKFRAVILWIVGLPLFASLVRAEEIFFPQVAAGGAVSEIGAETLLFINNTNPSSATIRGEFFGDAGESLDFKINGKSQSSFEQILKPGETVRLPISSDSVAAIPGWLKLSSEARIHATIVIRLLTRGEVVSEVGILPSSTRVTGTIVVEKESAVSTGLAMANPSNQELSAVLSLFDGSGSQIGEKIVSLPPKGHVARFLTEIFELDSANPSEFVGSVGISSNLPIVAVSLRLHELRVASVPVLDGHFVQTTARPLIVFVRADDIALYDLEKDEELELPGLNSVDSRRNSPAITPDGRWIVYKSTPTNSFFGDLFVYDRETASSSPLRTANELTLSRVDPDRRNLTFSNKGSLILFDMTRRSTHPGAPAVKGAVLLFDRLTDSFVPLPRIIDLKNAADTAADEDDLLTPSTDHAPFLSFDGALIAFSTYTSSTGYDILLFDRGKEDLVSLPGLNQPRADDTQPALSADGRFLVFVSNRKTPSKHVYFEQSDIFLYDLREWKLVDLPNLNDPNAIDGHPSIGKEGRFIVFHSKRTGNYDLFLYDRQENSLVSLPVNTSAWESQPHIIP